MMDSNLIERIKNNQYDNLPQSKDSSILHVRPHGRNANDVCKLPVPDKLTGLTEYTKHCFWINNTYIRDIFEEYI